MVIDLDTFLVGSLPASRGPGQAAAFCPCRPARCVTVALMRSGEAAERTAALRDWRADFPACSVRLRSCRDVQACHASWPGSWEQRQAVYEAGYRVLRRVGGSERLVLPPGRLCIKATSALLVGDTPGPASNAAGLPTHCCVGAWIQVLPDRPPYPRLRHNADALDDRNRARRAGRSRPVIAPALRRCHLAHPGQPSSLGAG